MPPGVLPSLHISTTLKDECLEYDRISPATSESTLSPPLDVIMFVCDEGGMSSQMLLLLAISEVPLSKGPLPRLLNLGIAKDPVSFERAMA